MTPAQLIAANLAAIPHPDGAPRVLAGFSTTMLPDNLQEQVSKAAADIGEGIVYLLESSGYRIVAENEVTPAEPDDSPPIAHLHCSLCDARLLSINVSNPAHAVTNGSVLISAMGGLRPECPHQ